MNTFLSSSQEALMEQHRAFAKEYIMPVAKDLENHTINLKDFLASKLGQNGYLGITVAKEYGGTGGSFITLVLLVEAICEFNAGLGLSLAAHYGVIELINQYGTDVQKSRYLPLLARGECIGALAINEAQAGTDFAAGMTTCSADGLLNGEKTWVVNGAIATLFAVLTRNDQNELSMRLVDLPGNDTVSVGLDRGKLGLRSAYTNDVKFSGLKVSKESLLGDEKSGVQAAQMAMDCTKVIVAAAAVGLVENALSHSAEHARTREQFGQKISQFQAIQWKLADMSAEASAARLLTYRAGWSKDEKPEEFRRNAAMCKLFATKVARVHSSEAVQILGSLGISSDSPVEMTYRDAKVMEICEGTSESQKLTLVEELGI